MVALPQSAAPVPHAQLPLHHVGAVALPGNEIPGRQQPPGVSALVLRDLPQGLPRPDRRLPGQRQIPPLILQLLLDVPLQHLQQLCRLASHAAGIRLRAGQLAFLRRSQAAGVGRLRDLPAAAGGQSLRRRFRVRLQRRIHPLPEPVMLAEVIDLRGMEILFH